MGGLAFNVDDYAGARLEGDGDNLSSLDIVNCPSAEQPLRAVEALFGDGCRL